MKPLLLRLVVAAVLLAWCAAMWLLNVWLTALVARGMGWVQ